MLEEKCKFFEEENVYIALYAERSVVFFDAQEEKYIFCSRCKIRVHI
jgi:hypothetical protein